MANIVFQSLYFVKEQYGWKAIPSFLIHSISENISGYILIGALKDAIPPVPPKLPLEIREATPEDAPKFSQIIPPIRIRRFVNKIKAGERCAIGLLNNDVIYFTWASFLGQLTAIESPIKLGLKDVYFWGAYCMPAYRRFGVGTSISSYHEDLLRQLGYEKGIRIIKFNNLPSQNLSKKLNLKVVGRTYGVRILKWKICRNIFSTDH
jgi:hypothetical protein